MCLTNQRTDYEMLGLVVFFKAFLRYAGQVERIVFLVLVVPIRHPPVL